MQKLNFVKTGLICKFGISPQSFSQELCPYITRFVYLSCSTPAHWNKSWSNSAPICGSPSVSTDTRACFLQLFFTTISVLQLITSPPRMAAPLSPAASALAIGLFSIPPSLGSGGQCQCSVWHTLSCFDSFLST